MHCEALLEIDDSVKFSDQVSLPRDGATKTEPNLQGSVFSLCLPYNTSQKYLVRVVAVFDLERIS